MVRFFLLAFCLIQGLSGLEFVFIPDYEPTVERLFIRGGVQDYKTASLWNKIQYLLNGQGHTVSAISAKEFHKFKKMKHVRFVVWNTAIPSSKLEEIERRRLMLLVFEPPSVLPKMHTDAYYSLFSKVLTWEDDRVDETKFFKYYHPVCYPMIHETTPFSERKLCTILAANKTSKFKGEIYSERRKAIEYFNQFPNEFDLYGPGWEKERLITYKGKVDDKINALKKYKFSICYENTVGMKGYITEKIFDCFLAGVIPVYLGAPNIASEIPSNCFIDKRNFTTYKQLHQYLASISEGEFNMYLDNIRIFLQSERARNYTQDSFALAVVNALTGSHLGWSDLP